MLAKGSSKMRCLSAKVLLIRTGHHNARLVNLLSHPSLPTMDPLSITASIVTFIDIAKRIKSSVDKVRLLLASFLIWC